MRRGCGLDLPVQPSPPPAAGTSGGRSRAGGNSAHRHRRRHARGLRDGWSGGVAGRRTTRAYVSDGDDGRRVPSLPGRQTPPGTRCAAALGCREGHAPGSVKLFVGNLPQQRRDVPQRPPGLVYRASRPGSLSVYPPRTRSTRSFQCAPDGPQDVPSPHAEHTTHVTCRTLRRGLPAVCRAADPGGLSTLWLVWFLLSHRCGAQQPLGSSDNVQVLERGGTVW
jgi:hypothetical protein